LARFVPQAAREQVEGSGFFGVVRIVKNLSGFAQVSENLLSLLMRPVAVLGDCLGFPRRSFEEIPAFRRVPWCRRR